jgi:hypothetical protein
LNAICSASPDDAGSVGTYNETDVGNAAFHSASISARVGMSVYSVIAAPLSGSLDQSVGVKELLRGEVRRRSWPRILSGLMGGLGFHVADGVGGDQPFAAGRFQDAQ